jgi:hypothetical protein
MQRMIDDTVRSLAVVHDEELEDAAASLQARIVFDAIVAEPRTAAKTLQRRTLGRALPLAAALAVAAVIAFAVAGTGGNPQGASAATVLHRAAQAARELQPLVPADGQFLYTKSVDAWTVNVDGRYTYLQPYTREVWLGPTGGRLVQTPGTPSFLSAADRADWVAAGSPDLHEETMVAPLDPTPALDLPSDPDALYARLQQQSVGNSNGVPNEMFTLVGDALRETASTAAQRAALYEVAARIPGVHLVGDVVDPVGRHGVAVGLTSRGGTRTLVFDPSTYALLAEEDVADANNPQGYAAGTVMGYAAYLTQTVVDSNAQRP